MGYKLPATGKIDLATWAVLQSGHDYQIKIAYNSPSNVVETMNLKGEAQTQSSTNVQLDVKRGDVLYIHYKPLEAVDGAWGGYKTELTYIEGGEAGWTIFLQKKSADPKAYTLQVYPMITYRTLNSGSAFIGIGIDA